ncbi:hypothetical protein HDU98_007052 [Podochytrium sp. JEL0797]|nr:hypothetical protein HDU98_007052 [Podochytrium sp. JEL0797]
MSKAQEAKSDSTDPLPPPPPTYSIVAPEASDPEAARLEAFRSLVQRHEISNLMALKLRQLEAFDIAIIADDSGSMQTKSTQGLNDPFAPALTRWDELKSTLSIVTDVAATLDADGIDVYFLNRPPLRNVTNADQLSPVFANPPRGYTPIARVLKQVLAEKSGPESKRLLILIATDGQPTTDSGHLDHQNLKNVLMYERGAPGHVLIAFLACTDDDAEIAYLEHWDRELRDLDVIDDYYTERRQIIAMQGPQFAFSRGDWVCKMLLGCVDSEIDALDERRIGGLGVPTVPSAGMSRSGSRNSRNSQRSSVNKKKGGCTIQ